MSDATENNSTSSTYVSRNQNMETLSVATDMDSALDCSSRSSVSSQTEETSSRLSYLRTVSGTTIRTGVSSKNSDVSSFAMSSVSSSLDTAAGSLDGCSLNSIDHVVDQLEDNDPTLVEFEVDCKRIDKITAADVGQCLPSNKHVKKIIIKCGNRSRHREIFQNVVSGLSCNTSIEHIHVQDGNITREMASALVPTFIHSKSLTHISMMNCKGCGLAQLFVAMQRNKRIRHLSFHSCYWEEHNTDLLASALPVMSIHTLTLVDINIADNGMPFLFRNIMNCSELQQLDLSKNELDSKTLRLLCSRLANRRSITNLTLQMCGLNDLCMKELYKGLREHPTLTNIDISQNILISDIRVVYLIDLLSKNSSITELNVDNCGLHKKTVHAIESGLNYNRSSLKLFLSRTVYDIFVGEESNTVPSDSRNVAFVGNDGTIIEGDDECTTLASLASCKNGRIITLNNTASEAVVIVEEGREDEEEGTETKLLTTEREEIVSQDEILLTNSVLTEGHAVCKERSVTGSVQ